MISLPVWMPGPVFLLGVSVSGPMFLPGCLCLGGGSLSRGYLSGGSLSRGSLSGRAPRQIPAVR